MNFVLIRRVARSNLDLIAEYVEFSVTFKGSRNLEWTVLPRGSNKEAISLDATGKTISP